MAKNNIFESEADFLAKLKEQGWSPPTDPDELAETARMLGSQIAFLRPYVDSLYASNQDEEWIHYSSKWETSPSFQVTDTRRDFLAACVRVCVEPVQLVDFKSRWEEAKFTAVTKKFYVMGNVSIPRPSTCSLPLKDECDVAAQNVDVGRHSLSFINYQNISEDIEGIRFKINGDRFVVIEKQGKYFLSGYEVLELVCKPTFSVLERYGGEFYVIYPYDHGPISNVTYKSGNSEKSFPVRAHPWLSHANFSRHDLLSTKYEGVMILVKGKEYRVKWNETVEILLDGEVWEVMLYEDVKGVSQFRPMRPRPGKVPISINAAKSQIHASVPGRYFIKNVRINSTRHKVSGQKRVVTGAKVLFLSDKGFWLIRDGIKPLDLIGGTSLPGETPLETVVREVYEETKVRVDPQDFVDIGVSSEEMTDSIWDTTIFLAPIPVDMKKSKGMFFFTQSVSELISTFYAEKGVAQLWTIRLLERIEMLGGARAMRAILVSHYLLPNEGNILVTDNSYPFLNCTGLLTMIDLPPADSYDDFEKRVFRRCGPNQLLVNACHFYWQFRVPEQHQNYGSGTRSEVVKKYKDEIIKKRRTMFAKDSKGAYLNFTPADKDFSVKLKDKKQCSKCYAFDAFAGDFGCSCPDELECNKCGEKDCNCRSPCLACKKVPCACDVAPSDVVKEKISQFKTPKHFPDSKIAARSILKEILINRPKMEITAQELYKEFSRLGFPGTRVTKVKFIEKCIAWGVVSDSRHPGGRSFTYLAES
jgi:hypothetical protein